MGKISKVTVRGDIQLFLRKVKLLKKCNLKIKFEMNLFSPNCLQCMWKVGGKWE